MAPPVGVVVDLDSVRTAPARLIRSGIGDAVSNLSAIADWELAAAHVAEPVAFGQLVSCLTLTLEFIAGRQTQ